ncbi:MAG: alpha/beta fold hydrolase [Chloroflexi bacterium]|nr:alpha/beta fold hydrolase [Chloroflexota bacterium]
MSYQFTEINGVRMHYDVQGEGDALVLIHAGIADLTMWDEQVAEFSKHFKTIRHDVRGWGETPDPAGKYTDHGDLGALLDHLGVDLVSVVGISNGGRIAIDFAVGNPGRMDKLIVVAPGLGGFQYPDDAFDANLSKLSEEAQAKGDIDMAAEYQTQLWFDGPHRTPDQTDPQVRKRALSLIRSSLEIPLGEGEGDIERPPAAGRLAEIGAPTLVIFGELDVESLKPVADKLSSEIPNAKKVVMHGVAHLPSLEKPNEFNEIVLDFLRE